MIAFVDEVAAETLELGSIFDRRLFGVLSWPRGGSRQGVVILPPGYERRIHHYSILSRYLVRHGYATVRFDLSNHIGLSEGDVIDLTMSSMSDDIRAVLEEVAGWDTGPQFVVASSLTARASMRAVAQDADREARLASLVLLLPVVDVSYTMAEVIGVDVSENWRSGRVTDPAATERVLSHDVSYKFPRDLIETGLADLDGTKADLASIGCPITAVAAERDDWVKVDQVREAMAVDAPAPRYTIVLEAASHEFSSNAPVVRLIMEQILSALARDAGESPPAVRHLEFDEVVETTRCERAWKHESYKSLPVREVVT